MLKSLLAVTAASALIVLGTGASEAAQSYPMICKGGGAMQARVLANGTIQLRFDPSASAGDAQPGQCAWIDRGFRSGEPTTLSLRGDRRGMNYLLDGMLSGDRFYVHGYNNGSGAMVVTRIGP